MTAAATTGVPVLHVAGPMIGGIQRCRACRTVLVDESAVLDPRHIPGSWRYTVGFRVLVLPVSDVAGITGPYPEKAPLPPGTRLCRTPRTTRRSSPPTSEKSPS